MEQFIIAVLSLAIALVALLGTFLQLVQQYSASAVGYRRCSREVIGDWVRTRKRRLHLTSLRFEITFKAPVIFACPASNTKGPVRGAEVHHVDGSPKSQELTRTPLPVTYTEPNREFTLKRVFTVSRHNENANRAPFAFSTSAAEIALSNNNMRKRFNIGRSAPADQGMHELDEDKKERVHNQNNELATWVTMLTELQRMEKESQEWQMDELHRPANRDDTGMDRAPLPFHHRTLVVAVQGQKRSWDTMAPSLWGTYATSTISHMVEIMAMLGLQWQIFEQATDQYLAKGNGYTLKGSYVPDLGILFSFRQHAVSHQFAENRIIPVDMVKDFVFGIIPTIFSEKEDHRRLAFVADDFRDDWRLLFGSLTEVADTIAWFGANSRTKKML